MSRDGIGSHIYKKLDEYFRLKNLFQTDYSDGKITSDENDNKFEYTASRIIGCENKKTKIPFIRLKFYDKTVELLTSLGVSFKKTADSY